MKKSNSGQSSVRYKHGYAGAVTSTDLVIASSKLPTLDIVDPK